MPLKYQLDSLESVPEALHEYYTESGGAFVLAVEGVKPAADFQKVMTSLEAERQEHKSTKAKLTAFNGTTPEDVLGLKTKAMELEAAIKANGGDLDDSKLDELVKQRLLPFEAKEKKLMDELATATEQMAAMKAEATNAKRKASVLDEIGTKVKSEFHKDLLYRAERELTYSEDVDGFVDSLGTGLQEWAMRQLRETPSWAASSKGAGANGGNGAPNASKNPFAKGTPHYNLTEQARLMMEDPKRAEQLKAQASGK